MVQSMQWAQKMLKISNTIIFRYHAIRRYELKYSKKSFKTQMKIRLGVASKFRSVSVQEVLQEKRYIAGVLKYVDIL